MKNLILLSILIFSSVFAQADFDRKTYYEALYSKDITLVDKQITIVDKLSANQKDAFTGTLLMKKAELVIDVMEKLSLFRAGKKKLEAAILNDNRNSEYRFLRLIIQEYTPRFLQYNSNLSEDAQFIKNNLSSFSVAMKKIIQDYSKTSVHLKL